MIFFMLIIRNRPLPLLFNSLFRIFSYSVIIYDCIQKEQVPKKWEENFRFPPVIRSFATAGYVYLLKYPSCMVMGGSVTVNIQSSFSSVCRLEQ